jgi:hypothetical protein
MLTPNTAKRSAPTFTLKARMIAAIIVEPQTDKNGGNEQAVDERDNLQAHE